MDEAAFVAALKHYVRPEPWIEKAVCRGVVARNPDGPNPFFPDRGQSKKPGQAYCARCPVQKECTDYRDRTESEEGIWGGFLYSRGSRPPEEPKPIEERIVMIPRSLSASSAKVYEYCPARWRAEYFERGPALSGTAASLGTACHWAMENFVLSGAYTGQIPDPNVPDAMIQVDQWACLLAFYDQGYWAEFTDSTRYEEGKGLLKTWLARQDWSDRTVLSCEQKLSFTLKSSVGDIPFNYVMDRVDRKSNGDIEVIDYKSLSRPMPPAALRHLIQARCYGLAAQIQYPDAERIWVTFDMLRFEPIGVVFTKEENRDTWRYLQKLVERIIKDDGTTEKLNEDCPYCVRKHECDTLQRHIKVGGALGITDPVAAAAKRHDLKNAAAALKTMIDDLDRIVLADMEAREATTLTVPGVEVSLSARKTRDIEASMLADIVGADVVAKMGKVNIGAVDTLLKSGTLTDAQSARVKLLIRTTYSDPYVVTKDAKVI